MGLFILSWFPLLLESVAKARIAANGQWWWDLYPLAPSMRVLRPFWFITIPLVTFGLVASALALVVRVRSAALIAAAFLFASVIVGVVDLGLIVLSNYQLTSTVSPALGIPRQEIAGLQPGIAADIGLLVYKSVCLVVLFYGRQVSESFGPVTLRRLRWWVLSVFRDEETPDRAAV